MRRVYQGVPMSTAQFVTIVALQILQWSSLGAGLAWTAWQVIKRLNWQHNTIVPWIDAVNAKMELPK
jgi:hypothetical protein